MSKVHIKTAIGLLNIVWPEFGEVNGAIFRKGGTRVVGTEDMDTTGREAFANHQHILDLFQHKAYKTGDTEDFYIPSHPDFIAACEFGKKLATIWFSKLRQDFPHHRFRVYYTQDDNPIVRFHRVRDDEPFWLSEADHRQAITDGKVMVLDSGR